MFKHVCVILAMFGAFWPGNDGVRAAEIILTVTGHTAATANGTKIEFTLKSFEALGLTKIRTKTPWNKSPVDYEGVSGIKLQEVIGFKGKTIKALALNDYAVTIPVSDLVNSGLIFATRRNGEYMPVRDKGLIFVIYPFDSNPELQNKLIHSRSIWQMDRLEGE